MAVRTKTKARKKKALPKAILEDGAPDAPILVVCDTPGATAFKAQAVMTENAMDLFAQVAEQNGFTPDDFRFITPAPTVKERDIHSAARTRKWLQRFHPLFWKKANNRFAQHKLILCLGNNALLQVANRPSRIGSYRGQLRTIDGVDVPVFTMNAPSFVQRRPDQLETFVSDFYMLRRIADANYAADALEIENVEKVYTFCTDLSDWIEDPPAAMSVDTEGTGLEWYLDSVYPITVQLCCEAGHSVVVPCWPGVFEGVSNKTIRKLQRQLKALLENEDIKKAAHNISYDHKMLRKIGAETKGWLAETQILAFACDENLVQKNLDECTKRYVPEMAGYADRFNREIDKSKMLECAQNEFDKFLQYAGGDPDATFRLAKRTFQLLRKDPLMYNLYERVMLPASRVFCDDMESYGVRFDVEALRDFEAYLEEEEARQYDKLIRMVPRRLRRIHAEKGLKFSRPDFVRDILFSKDGYDLIPIVFTKSTQKLEDHEKVPSTSAKDHLPFFMDCPIVPELIQYQKLQKIRSTYVGTEEEGTGFWKYLQTTNTDIIYPSFHLHRTVTGRSASSNPNFQNLPKRGDMAKAFRKLIIPRDGYKLIECDLSQAELRIAAWMAMEAHMIEIYEQGGDIHATTAAATMGISLDEFNALDKETRDYKRFLAKAVNFGFLYGMSATGFKIYAKTEYGIDFTDEEAWEMRTTFFEQYPGLLDWHAAMVEFVHEHGYVRALHGAIRRLPNVFSYDEAQVALAERQAINSPVQRFASDLGLIGMIRFARDVPREIAKPLLFIHDALVLEVKEEHADEMARHVKWYMQSAPLLEWFGLEPPLPIIADVSVGDNLGEMHELKGLEAECPDWYSEAYD